MKVVVSTFIALIYSTGAIMAADQPALAAVDSLATTPGDYSGKVVAVWGIIERVSEARKMFTLIDASEAGCTDGCQRAVIVAQVGNDVNPLPKAMEPVIAIGKVDTSASPMRVTVSELVSGKEAVDARLKELSAK